MKKTSLGLIAALLFVFATAGAFYWLWTTSNVPVSSTGTTASNYTVVEIESVKAEAVSILSGLENKAGIPIGIPTEKMGRANPYVNY